MRYLFAFLPLIGGALASPLPSPEDAFSQPSWGFEVVTTTVTGSVGTVIATRTQWMSDDNLTSVNQGTTAFVTSVVTSYSRHSESTWTTAPSSSSESSATRTSTTARPTSTTTSDERESSTKQEDKPSSTESKQPEATEFTPPANDMKNSAKVEQAARDVQEAGVFALFESNAPIKLEGSEEEKDIKDHFKCTLKLHPAPAGRYAYLQALASNPWYNYKDSDCIMEIKCDDWERDKEDGCTAQPD
ncbi:uncharacterized protein L199_000793 [Kwoniella botswanensis]|uniref:uncharacterized protein n=1 Tax=Kwoniella botswanensis TaxID=1268659 RepID=UPI00315C8513